MLSAKTDVKKMLVADAVLLLVAFFWGVGIPLTADLARETTPLWANTLRMITAAVAVCVIYARRISRATVREWIAGFKLSFFDAATYPLVGLGLVFSTASKQSFVIGLQVILVPLAAWAIYKKMPSAYVFVGAALGTIGTCIMGFTPGMEFNIGDAVNLIMIMISVGRVLMLEHLVREIDATTLIVCELPFVAVMMTALSFAAEGVPDIGAITGVGWMQVLYLGLVNTIICFVLQSRAMVNTTASHSAVILALESVFGYLVSVVSGQDPFVLQIALGGAVILAGVFTSEAELIIGADRRHREDRETPP